MKIRIPIILLILSVAATLPEGKRVFSQSDPQKPLATAPSLSVDVSAGRHTISPYIYGMSFADESLAAELRLPLNRYGGNATTRYNWQNDTSNRASDWFFENIPNGNTNPEQLPNGSASDQFVEQNKRTGTDTLLTVPLIGWTPKSRAYACGFSVAKYHAQDQVDPYRTDCGNGVHNGQNVTGNDPADTSIAITPGFVQDWMLHLIGRYGSANTGGVRLYNLDNEPMLWDSTHRDVHPLPTSYDELRDRTYQYAAAIKASDSNAKTLGPVVWGWTAYFWSALDWFPGGSWWNNPQDRLAHGNTPFLEWYLQQMKDYESAHQQRILDYLDVHFYPQNGVFSTAAGDAATQALRLRSTRTMWDPTYVDESWIGEPVALIPRLRAWVQANYPGTKTALSEYSWGAAGSLNGALAEADLLGIFGREQLDLAALWTAPASNEPMAYAFRIYRNYDGAGSAFGDTAVQAASSSQDQLAIYAAQRGRDAAVTLVVINKTGGSLGTHVNLSGFSPAGSARVFRYSAANLNSIERLPDLGVTAGGFDTAFAANSITLIELLPGVPLVPGIWLPDVIN